jgi:4,5-DOPA dioxygenase extradiol
MTPEHRMPVLFIGHGNPMNAIEETPFAAAWRESASTIPRSQAILSVSAHRETDGTKVTTMASPRTIHDFSDFPQELFQVRYPAPGAPGLAHRVVELLGAEEIGGTI